MKADKRLKIPQITVTFANNSGTIRVKKHGPFVFKKCSKDSGQTDYWYLKDKAGKQYGQFYLAIRKNDTMCVCSSSLESELHGVGIGKKMYQHLVDYYGALESDPDGTTSKQARRVWKALGAKETVKKNEWGRETRFRLESKSNPLPKKESQWAIFISSMMSWFKQVKLIPTKSLSKIG